MGLSAGIAFKRQNLTSKVGPALKGLLSPVVLFVHFNPLDLLSDCGKHFNRDMWSYIWAE